MFKAATCVTVDVSRNAEVQLQIVWLASTLCEKLIGTLQRKKKMDEPSWVLAVKPLKTSAC